MLLIARFSPHTQAMYDFSSHQTPYFALYQLLGAGVFEAKVEHNSMAAQVLGALGSFGGFWGPLRGKCNERRKLLLHFLHIRTLDLAA